MVKRRDFHRDSLRRRSRLSAKAATPRASSLCKGRAGPDQNFTGISSPYEAPLKKAAELRVATGLQSLEESVAQVNRLPGEGSDH